MFRDAAYVLTDSFHGTAFSINLQKKAAVFERFSDNDSMNQNSRIYNILSKINAVSMLTKIDENPQKLIDRIDSWEEINNKLAEERQKSVEYLGNCLNAVCKNKDTK